MKKLICIAFFILAGYFTYTFLLTPPHVTLDTYKQIRQGMSRSQFEALLKSGKFRGSSVDPTRRYDVAYSETDPRYCADLEALLEECEKDSREAVRRMTSVKPPEGSGTIIKGKVTSNEGTWNYDAMGLSSAVFRNEIVSKEGILKPDNTFVPAKHVKFHGDISRGAGGINNINSSAEYEFHEYLLDVTVNRLQYKVIRNGNVNFSNLTGKFECWKGSDAKRVITILFSDDKVNYWSYQGPKEDFPITTTQIFEQQKASQPEPEVKAQLPEVPAQKAAMKEEKLPSKETSSAPVIVLKDAASLKVVEQPKQEVVLQTPAKDDVELKIEGYQRRIDEARKSLDTVMKQRTQAKIDYETAAKQYVQLNDEFQKRVSNAKVLNSSPQATDRLVKDCKTDMDSKKKAYDALNAQIEKLNSNIYTYNRFIDKLKTKDLIGQISKPEEIP